MSTHGMAKLALASIASIFIFTTACTTTENTDTTVAHAPDSDHHSTLLHVGQTHTGTLSPHQTKRFSVTAEEQQFVFARLTQLKTDLKVHVFGPDDNELFVFDTTKIGPDYFSFDSPQAGLYRLEIAAVNSASTAPFELELLRHEPVAEPPAERVKQLMAAYDNDHTPGAVLGIVENGVVTYGDSFGMANLAFDIPMQLSMPTNLGSVSKQFTAMAILLMEQQGKLSLDDDIRAYLPELPEFAHTVTINHLLNHTNGLREMYNILAMRGYAFEDYLDRATAIELITRQPALQVEPGTDFNYNNTAFVLLTFIAERVSEQPFPEWMQKYVFAPLGMDNTYVRRDPGQIIPMASQGYDLDENGYREAGDLYAAYGAGGIYSTVEDMAKWMNNYHSAQLGGRAVIDKMTTPTTLNDGEVENYGLGLGISEYRGLKMFRHGGADNAHRTDFVYFPDIDKGLFISSNNAWFDTRSYDIIDVFFEQHLAPVEEKTSNSPQTGATLSDAQLAGLAGHFKSDKLGMNFEIISENNQIKLKFDETDIMPLHAKSETTFVTSDGNYTIEFHVDNAMSNGLTFTTKSGTDYEFIKIEKYQPSMAELEAFTGTYFSQELAVVYDIVIDDASLALKIYGRPALPLEPTEQHTFYGDGFLLSNLKFMQNGAGKITQIEVSNGRTQDVMFERME